MNLVGKIFIVLIAVMCLVFSAFAVMVYATHTNWRQMVVNTDPGKPLGLQSELKNASEANTALKNQLAGLEDSYKSQLNEKEQRLGKLETEVKELARVREEALKDLASKEALARETTAALKAKQDNEAALLKERDALREQARSVREDRDKQFKLVVQRTDEMHQAVSEVKRLTKRNEELSADLVRARDLLTRLGYDAEKNYPEIPPPVEGVVLAVQGNDLIEISIGSDQGLLKGHKLHAYRVDGSASTYLGRVEVVKTEPNRAVCKVDPTFPRKGPIQNGDRVASKID